MAGIRILALGVDGGDAGETITDDEGFYLVSRLRPGRYAVFVGLESALASRFGARGVDVAAGAVALLDLREATAGATVRVRALTADGAPVPAQAILLDGPPGDASSAGSLLARDAVRIPELGAARLVLTHVPAGVYTIVLLRGPELPPLAARQPLHVAGAGEIAIDVRVPADDVPRS